MCTACKLLWAAVYLAFVGSFVGCTPPISESGDSTDETVSVAVSDVEPGEGSSETVGSNGPSDVKAEGQAISTPENESIQQPVKPNTGATSLSDTIDITFDDIRLPIQEDMVFRPFMMTEREP